MQKRAAEIVLELDRKFSVNRTEQLALAQLVEELGELAKEINRPALRHQKAERALLEDEFADTAIQLLALATKHDVDIEGAVTAKIAKLVEKHRLPK